MEIADRRGDVGIELRAVDDAVRAGGGGARLLIRPGLPRRHEAELGKPEIGHRTRGEADILRELRADEDDRRRRLRCGFAAAAASA